MIVLTLRLLWVLQKLNDAISWCLINLQKTVDKTSRFSHKVNCITLTLRLLEKKHELLAG